MERELSSLYFNPKQSVFFKTTTIDIEINFNFNLCLSCIPSFNLELVIFVQSEAEQKFTLLFGLTC